MRNGLFLRIYLTESDTIDGKPAMDAVLELCMQAGLHGVTVLRGIEGLGLHGVHTSAFLSLASQLPLVIEVVDEAEKIHHAVEMLRPHLGDRLLATWPVSIARTSEENT